jgi:Pericentrin-AKAP-450 domain of centrosomal targeting protein
VRTIMRGQYCHTRRRPGTDDPIVYPRSPDLSEMRAQHVRECKGLMLQIRYLKTKYMRESDLRADMIHQKSYLSMLVGGLERNEEATRKYIADISLSRNIPPAPKSGLARFRQVAFAVKAVARMR